MHMDAFAELEASVETALMFYANVHRGSGHNSLVSTALYERARSLVLEHLQLDAARYTVIFCSAGRGAALTAQLLPGSYHTLSSAELGLPLGVQALAVERRALPGGRPFQSGGGVVKLVSRQGVLWADAPDRYEAGTPAIVNVIAFARALQLRRLYGAQAFQTKAAPLSVADILYRDEFAALHGRALLLALRGALVGRGARIPTEAGVQRYVNLDNGASTPTFRPIWETVRRVWRQPAAVQAAVVREVAAQCAEFFHAPASDYDVLFTSNTTEALNLAARALQLDFAGATPVVLTSLLEHHSNDLPWRYRPGVALIRLAVDAEGFVDLAALEATLRAHAPADGAGARRVGVVALCGASNVLGTFNDLRAIGEIVHRYGALLVVDAAQQVAHRRIDMVADAIDVLAFSAHKVYAPFGGGALLIRKGLLDPAALAEGHAVEMENAAGIAALGKALDLLRRIGLNEIEAEERALTARALRGLAGIPGIQCYGVADPAAPRFAQRGSVITFRLKHVPHNLLAQRLAERAGIGVRNGCFCAHLLVKQLMGIRPWRERLAELGLFVLPRFTASVLPGLVRASIGLENDAADVDVLIAAVDAVAREPRTWLERALGGTHNATPFLPRTEAGARLATFVATTVAQIYGAADCTIEAPGHSRISENAEFM